MSIPKLKPLIAFTLALFMAVTSNEEMDEDMDDSTFAIILKNRVTPYLSAYGIDNTNWLVNESLSMYLGGKVKWLDWFEPISNSLTEEQRLITLMNVCDLVMVDGIFGDNEKGLFVDFLDAFEITFEDFQPYFDTLLLKNKRTAFI